MIVIGSHSLPWRGRPSDVDLICTMDEIDSLISANKASIMSVDKLPRNKVAIRTNTRDDFRIYEIEVADDNLSSELESIVRQHNLTKGTFSNMFIGEEVPVVNLDVIYTLKMSHRFLRNSPHFEKTRYDILRLREVEASIPPVLQDWYDRRVAATYDYSHPVLKASKQEFFDTPGVSYKYDHDSIHLAVAIGKQPAYTHFKGDTEEVFCDRNKFENLPHIIKMCSVIEESMVLAIERCLVPFNFNTNPNVAFKMALQKVCTSISSGWWRDFAWEHYDEALKRFELLPTSYVEKFMDGLLDGTVTLHKEKAA